MHKEIKNMEELINVILAINAPRKKGDAPLQTSVSLPTPFGKVTARVMDFEFVSADPSLKNLKSQSAKDTPLAAVLQQTIGGYRDVVRRILAVSDMNIGSINQVKAENTTIWLLEGQRHPKDPDMANAKWKVVAAVSFELPGDSDR